MPLPPLGGIPWLLDRLGVLQDDPAQFDEASRRAGDVLTPHDRASPDRRLAAAVGVAPQVDETLGSFWGRQMPRTLPPSLKAPLGQDIALPTDRAPLAQAALTRRLGGK